MPVSTFVAVAVAFGTTAPLATLMVPTTVPVSTCARPVTAAPTSHRKTTAKVVFLTGDSPPRTRCSVDYDPLASTLLPPALTSIEAKLLLSHFLVASFYVF